MDNQIMQAGAALESTPLLSAGLFVIEVRRRRQDKTLAPWELRAAFVDRDDAFSVYGKWHQRECARVLTPNARSPCMMPLLVRWLLRRICRKLVVQGPEHAKRITEYYRIMRDAAEAEFMEDNDRTLTEFLRECWDADRVVPSKALLAFEQGRESGLFHGGSYSRGMNPYTSYASGVVKHRAWREGYIVGADEKRNRHEAAERSEVEL